MKLTIRGRISSKIHKLAQSVCDHYNIHRVQKDGVYCGLCEKLLTERNPYKIGEK